MWKFTLRLLTVVSLTAGVSCTLEPWERKISDGLGNVNLDTSTANADAQDYFIFGLKLVISFWHDLAEESFRKAQQLDPAFAMAYWGEALCKKWFLWNSDFPDDANAILRRMDENNPTMNAHETMYIDAVRALFKNATDENIRQRDQDFSTKMASLVEAYPGDHVAAAYYSISLLELNKLDEARDVLTSLLKADPNHPAGLHFALHAFDFHQEGVAEKGLAAADRYPTIVSQASHGDHMPAHIYIRLGMWKEAVKVERVALKAGDDFTNERKNGSDSYDKWNRYHSLEYLQYYLLQQARFKEAAQLLERMRKVIQAKPDDLFFRQTWYRMAARQYLESRNYDVGPVIFDPPAYVPLESDMFWSSFTEAGYLQSRAMQAMKLKFANATQLTNDALSRIDALISATEPKASWDYVTKAVKILKLQLQAAREISGGKSPEALKLMQQATGIQDTMVLLPSSPTLLFIPTYEFYGDIMHEYGNEPATALYVQSQAMYPNRAAWSFKRI
ncbi:uncharacterized protein LOC106154471 [Lingula anatina]|uniref:Uncharacterized protein LOC106154471 n=1 Tax=Lingula anatina TaxID=7574 RepID=A0A1S3HDZ9_LINAN|nr:uncharacterized protein LOC106154471 [Lingula anatina]|eukprot:XP_013384278.1 uncharacterized protein LOC106154471 [Lingula anatina]